MSDWLQIHSLADGELSAQERIDAEARLETCAVSRAELERIRTLKSTLQEKCSEATPLEGWPSCVKRLNEIDKARRVEGFVGRYAWGLCGAFLVAIIVGASASRANSHSLHSSDVVRASAGWEPLSTPNSSQPSEQQRWVRGIFDGVEPVKSGTFFVQGAARGHLNGLPVTRLDIVDKIGPLELFIIQGGSLAEAGPEGYAPVRVQGQAGIAWSSGMRTFLLVGDRSNEKLTEVADTIRSH